MDTTLMTRSLARVFYAAERGRWSGEIELVTGASVVIGGGRIAAVHGVEAPPLGDVLRAHGLLRDARFEGPRAMSSHREAPRIGAAMIAAGVASGAAVERALAFQLEQRLIAIVRRGGSIRAVRAASAREPPTYSLQASQALFAAVAATLAELPDRCVSARSGQESFELSEFGARWFAAIHAAGSALASQHDLARALAGCARDVAARKEGRAEGDSPLEPELPRSLHLLRACLRALGLLAVSGERAPQRRGYSVLARKRRELARCTSPDVLLELEGADAHARRRALRRLAAVLHPDRFARDSAAIRAIASDTLRALVDAERSLSAPRA